MLKELVKVANRLDSLGLTREADVLDRWINKVAAGFSKQREAEIQQFITQTLPSLFSSVAMSVDQKGKKILSYSLDQKNPLYMTIVGLLNDPAKVNLTYDDVRRGIIQGFENTKTKDTAIYRDTSFSYNTMTFKDGSNPPGQSAAGLFDNVIVKSVFAEIQKNKSSLQGSQVTDPGVQALTAPVTYPKTTPPTTTPKKTPSGTPTKPSTSAPKRDWAYYLSKQTEEVGKAMEKLWSKASGAMGLSSDYASFVKWYKSKGKNMNTRDAADEMFTDAIALSKDPVITSVRSSRARQSPEYATAMYTYLGLDLKTKLPADGGASANARIMLEKIAPAMRQESEGQIVGSAPEDFRKTRVNKY